jgi:hypothetical protein
MSGIALAMFIALFAFGTEIVGYRDPDGKVQLALFATFVFGLLVGYRTRG